MLMRLRLTALAGLLAVGFAGNAQAMPVSNLAALETGAQPEAIRLVCDRFGRCWRQRRPIYRPYAYVPGPRFYVGGPRFYGHRHHGHRHGWRHRW